MNHDDTQHVTDRRPYLIRQDLEGRCRLPTHRNPPTTIRASGLLGESWRVDDALPQWGLDVTSDGGVLNANVHPGTSLISSRSRQPVPFPSLSARCY